MRFSGSSNPSGGFVNTVINTVTVDPATVVAGVSGAVGSVAAPVSVDPATVVAGVTGQVDTKVTSTIATVSTSVPFPFRDGAFWPCVSGEQFPPSLTASTYSNLNGLPVVIGTPPAVATWALVPRISFSGKQTIKLSLKAFIKALGTAGALYIGFNMSNNIGTALQAGLMIDTLGNVFTLYSDGAAHHQSASLFTVAPSVSPWPEIDLTVTLAANGAITIQLVNAGTSYTTTSAANTWLPTSDVTPVLKMTNGGNAGPTAGVAAVEIDWT